jgi:DNA topoisomerase-1
LKELTNNGTTIKLLAGRYGPYVTDGTTNASVPKGVNPESVTFERAVELLEARRNAAPTPRRGAAGGRRRAAAAAPRVRKTTRKAAGA